MSISVVVPIHNEQESIRPLYERLAAVLACLGRPWEVIFVDDGSQDGSARELERLARRDRRVRVIEFDGNFGQSAALHAGIRAAAGEAVVTMDGDLQNDPADIPMLLSKLDEGYDLVHGWRTKRRDPLLTRRLPSLVANRLISRLTGVEVHDLGCTLKAIRRELALQLDLRDGLHRFIPILAHARGARCVEVATRHEPRRFGRSKYGIGRVIPVLRDLAAISVEMHRLRPPAQRFATIEWLGRLAARLRSEKAGPAYRIRRMLNCDEPDRLPPRIESGTTLRVVLCESESRTTLGEAPPAPGLRESSEPAIHGANLLMAGERR